MRVEITFKASVILNGDNLEEISKKWQNLGVSADGEDVDVHGIDYAEDDDCDDITIELINELYK